MGTSRRRTCQPSRTTLEPLAAVVNQGRWMVICDCAGSANPVEPGEDYLCPTCETWHTVTFPDNRADIEALLLAVPGHRLAAPNRNWRPA